jgi:pimeloyl-ACP methyl ester carboxylesterase
VEGELDRAAPQSLPDVSGPDVSQPDVSQPGDTAPLPVEERRVRVADDVTLRTLVHRPAEETGAPFLLVHGLASNALLWSGVARRLAAAGHVAVAVDQRAHGRSDASDALDFATLSADLVVVTETLGLDRPIAVGQSWGGNVVLEFAVRHAEVARSAVAVDGGLIQLGDRFDTFDDCWAQLSPPEFDGMDLATLAGHVATRCAGWPEGAAEAQMASMIAGADGSVRAILTRERHRRIVGHLFAHRPLDRLVALEVPMLLMPVVGGSRRIVDERLIARARELGDVEVVRLEGRDHDVHLEDPETVASLLIRWAAGEALPEVA